MKSREERRRREEDMKGEGHVEMSRGAEEEEKTNACPQTPPVDCRHTSMCATSTVMLSYLPLQVLMNLASRMGLSSPRRMCSLAS